MSPRPRLSVCCMTANSADCLEDWAALTRDYADELVIVVDDASSDDTLGVARRVADRVAVVEHPPFVEVTRDVVLRQATGEWLLLLDDDEVMAPGFAGRLGELVDDGYLTHYWLPYRWVLRNADGSYGWLRTFPWYPNPRARLLRNVGSIFADRGRLHAPVDIAGAGRVLDDDDTAIYHLDFVRRDRAAREAKVERYRGHNAPSCEEYYLWEDYRATLDVVPLDEEVVKGTPTDAARARAEGAARCLADVGPVVTLADQRNSSARNWATADVYHADYLGSTTPAQVLANRGYAVTVTVRNTSDLRWRTTGLGAGRVVLSYHWVHPVHGMLLRDGDVALLPHEPAPGEALAVVAGVWTPFDPGRYRLEWDLRAEESNWFSERGVAPLVVEVEVADHDRLLERRRAVASLPPRAASVAAGPSRPQILARRGLAGLRAGRNALAGHDPASLVASANVIPLRSERALDTRDGSGFPGAPNGPIAAGSVVTLRVTGRGGIPDTAVGIVATVAVLDATYNGFVTAYAADGTEGTGAVSCYFADDGRPSAAQVLVAVGTGRHYGQVALHVSDNFPGTVQILFDVVGYLA
ncbi:MAG TPA: glycosyltransferase [Acidimicrobiales bacterium]|nr:glycosyltransferase [Acidimicrobiales bacterium]